MRKVLIANRGEIAVRVARCLRENEMRSIAIFTEADAQALHPRCCDQAFEVDSYLNVEAILEVAKKAKADAVHPGYGFLSENAAFARACGEAGLTFIGPTPEVIEAMGDKLVSKETMKKAGVPVVPSWSGPLEKAAEGADEVGFPLLVKAAAGGGGKGMRRVDSPQQLDEAIRLASSEAAKAFGDARVFLERYIEEPRHVEFQIFGDSQGNVVHLGERECSIQRRYQKIVEESPCTALTPELRRQMGEAAVAAARTLGYTNAGTVEFILGQDGGFYFLEVNTRLQVEHPVTELVTGLDLVQLQLQVAQGQPLGFSQEEVTFRGSAIECRLYAEDPANNFMPSIGKLGVFRPPNISHLRLDSGVEENSEVTIHYDPMLAKLVVWGSSREIARRRMVEALESFPILGVTTNLEFLAEVLKHPEFAAGNTHTHFLQQHQVPPRHPGELPLLVPALAAAAGGDRARTREAAVEQSPWADMGGWRMGS